MKNYRLSDDIAFRFSDKHWKEWPLTVDKYIQWLETDTLRGPLINLFMDFETFGENIWEDTGIFKFFEHLVYRWDRDKDNNFLTVSEACDAAEPTAEGAIITDLSNVNIIFSRRAAERSLRRKSPLQELRRAGIYVRMQGKIRSTVRSFSSSVRHIIMS